MSKEIEVLKSKIFNWRKTSGEGPVKIPCEIRSAVGMLETEMNLTELATTLGLGTATIFRCRKEYKKVRENKSKQESSSKELTNIIPKATKVFIGGTEDLRKFSMESKVTFQNHVVARVTIGKAKIEILEPQSLLVLCSGLLGKE